MKSIKNILGLSMGLMIGMSVTSCNDTVEYNPAESLSGAQVFFVPSEYGVNPSTVDLLEGEGSFEVVLQRGVTKGDLEVAIELVQEGDHTPLVAPNTANFKDGEDKDTIVVTYNSTGMEYEEPVKVKMTITDKANITPYSYSEYEFIAAIPAPWTDWYCTKAAWVEAGYDKNAWPLSEKDSTCTYTYNGAYSGEDPGYRIAYRQYLLDPTVAQFSIQPWANTDELIIDYNTVTHDCHVALQKTGDQYSNGEDIVACDLETYNPKYTHDEYPCNYNPETGKFELYLYYFLSLGVWEGLETIQLDGFYIPDYSITTTYDGVLTNANQESFAQIFVDWGTDVKSAKAYIAQASDDAAAVADALSSGDLEGVSLVKGLNKLPLDDLTGELKVVAAAIVDNTTVNWTETSFEYYGGGRAPWKSLGMGLYTDDILTPFFATNEEGVQEIPTPTYSVEIKENDTVPGLYRIMNPYCMGVYPYADEDFAPAGMFIEVNATDPNYVYIVPQSLGMDWGYGPMGIASYAGYYMPEYDFDKEAVINEENVHGGVLKDGVIKFPTYKAQNGLKFQGIFFLGGDGYYVGNGDWKIVLPSAVPAEAKAKAPAMQHMTLGHKMTHATKFVMNTFKAKKRVRASKLVKFSR